MSSPYPVTAGGTTYQISTLPDPASLLFPTSYPFKVGLVTSQSYGTAPWPQTVKYQGNPISGSVYSPVNVNYKVDKNTLPTIDSTGGLRYKPPVPPPPFVVPVVPPRHPHLITLLAIGVGIIVIAVLIWYFVLRKKHRAHR